ncbi:hypothetical protein [Nostoc sp.]|uniref:hypothetical protein n=1 Tax=Nostoc sp. TaxID=1180 RepID=UPI002FFD2757
MNRRLYNNQSFVETAIYRVFVIYNFHQKTSTKRYWEVFVKAMSTTGYAYANKSCKKYK